MPRKIDRRKIEQAAELLKSRPGLRAGEYARILGCHRQAFNRLLVQLNDSRFLLSEDGKGRLWPFTGQDLG